MNPPLFEHRPIAIDTAPLIYFVESDGERSAVVRELLLRGSRGELELVVSAVTESELLVAPLRRDRAEAVAAVGSLLDGPAGISVLDVSREIAREVAGLRALHRLTLPDALIAATAIASGCTALLGNDAAFRRIGGPLDYQHLDDLV